MPVARGTTFAQPRLYYAVFDAACRFASSMARASIPRGTRVLREVDPEAGVIRNERDARTIWNGRLARVGRWTGAQPGGALEPGTGGLYVSLEAPAQLEDALRRGRAAPLSRRVEHGTVVVEPAAPRPLEEIASPRQFFVYELARSLSAADLTAGASRLFLERISREVDVRHELDGLRYSDLLVAVESLGEDSSITRAIGNAALMRSGAEALLVPSARRDYTALLGSTLPRGRNAVLGGPDGVPLAHLRPIARIVAEDAGGGVLACREAPL
jgi:hypothetical protein